MQGHKPGTEMTDAGHKPGTDMTGAGINLVQTRQMQEHKPGTDMTDKLIRDKYICNKNF